MKAIKFYWVVFPVAWMVASISAIAQQPTYTYECDNGKSFQAQYGTNSATVRVNNRSLTLPAVPASQQDPPGGNRYADNRYLLFTTANNTEAFVEVDGDRTHAGCIAQPLARSSSSSTSQSTSTRQSTSTGSTTSPVRGLW